MRHPGSIPGASTENLRQTAAFWEARHTRAVRSSVEPPAWGLHRGGGLGGPPASAMPGTRVQWPGTSRRGSVEAAMIQSPARESQDAGLLLQLRHERQPCPRPVRWLAGETPPTVPRCKVGSTAGSCRGTESAA